MRNCTTWSGLLGFVAVLALLASVSGRAFADESEGWPREITTPQAVILIYQPQPETFEGNILTARSAVSVTVGDTSEPVFGAIWVTARLETDLEARTATILDVEVTEVRFPEVTGDQKSRLTSLLEAEIPRWDLEISLDQLSATLATINRQLETAKNLNNSPPVILFSAEPAVLVTYDGEPELRKIEETDLMRVINTPYPVILENSTNTYYLSGGEVWYKAADALGPFQLESSPPKAVVSQVPVDEDTRASEDKSDISSEAPKVVVATVPTELIVSAGEPKYSPIVGTDLLYMTNTESDVLLEIKSQTSYVLLSGRWFAASSLDGPWTWVAAESLPEDFAKIPYESANGHLLTFVAGTSQAADAVMDNQIPQTSAVDRSQTSLTVTYDGEPQFSEIEGTAMAYALNTDKSVLRIDGRFYCCDEAVWYEANDPVGPWSVSTSVPASVQDLPPDCPVYNVKYVYIYSSTPEVVYVGYTPGYMGSYVYGPCLVYGTGYYYKPWWGPRYYYPRPATWSFHVRYNPYYGWSYGLSYSSGPFRLTVGFRGGSSGWWGPSRYHPYPYRSYRKTNINVNRNININTGRGRPELRRNQANIYNRPENRPRNSTRPASRDRAQAKVAPNRPNNLYSDRNGNVHRRTDQGWDQRQGGNWTKPDPGRSPGGKTQPGVAPANRPQQPSQLDRDSRARERGKNRSNRAPARQAPANRGGGARR